jgi:glucosamine--fructose-6-phosphate aminotransferase (isomerizing)
MCGIVAYVGTGEACPILVATLAKLQYLGRHSAGIAMLADGHVQVRRALGECANLAASIGAAPLAGSCGIAHTRGATVGSAAEINAHPHVSGDGRIAVVHSGDITNHAALRAELEAEGVVFRSETDSETIPHLIARHYREGATKGDAPRSVRAALARLEGSYAFAVVFADLPGRIIAVRMGSPLFIGRGAAGGELLLSSDLRSLRGRARRVCLFRDGQMVEVGTDGMALSTVAGEPLEPVFRPWWVAFSAVSLHMAARRCRQRLSAWWSRCRRHVPAPRRA